MSKKYLVFVIIDKWKSEFWSHVTWLRFKCMWQLLVKAYSIVNLQNLQNLYGARLRVHLNEAALLCRKLELEILSNFWQKSVSPVLTTSAERFVGYSLLYIYRLV
jgi:hypothetical protein